MVLNEYTSFGPIYIKHKDCIFFFLFQHNFFQAVWKETRNYGLGFVV